MGFMEKQVTDKQMWIEIDGPCGTTWVPADIARDVVVAVKLGNESRAKELALEFYEGSTVWTVDLREGYGARFSAPGYMDCTEWSVFDTAEDAEAYLADQDDSDDMEGEI
jgi:hypothetical protein